MKRMIQGISAAGLILTGMVGAAGAASADLESALGAVARGEAPQAGGLAKTSVLTSTTYISAYFNANFTCPPGWTITTADSTPERMLLNVAKAGRNSVLVYLTRNATAAEATFRDSYSTFLAVRTTYGSASGYPAVMVAYDTSASPVHVSYVNLEYDPPGGTRVYDLYAFSTSIYSHFVAYSAATADYDLNYADYDAITEGLDFYSTVTINGEPQDPLLKGAAGVTFRGHTVLNPNGYKIDFLDSKGRKRLASSAKRIEIDRTEKLFLKIQAK